MRMEIKNEGIRDYLKVVITYVLKSDEEAEETSLAHAKMTAAKTRTQKVELWSKSQTKNERERVKKGFPAEALITLSGDLAE